LVTALRLIKVSSNDATRVFNSLTHPTASGSSRLTLSFHSSSRQVPAELLLLVDILHEEYQAHVWTPTVALPTDAPRSERNVPKTNSFIGGFELPAPTPEVVCEFDVLVGEFKRPTGRVVSVVFHGLTMVARKRKVYRVEHCEETGDSVEETGVRRNPLRHQRASSAKNSHRKTG
jgi:hypothetical protein